MSGLSESKKKRHRLLYVGAAVLVFVAMSLLFDLFPDQQRELLRGLRDAAEDTFPEQAARAADSYGLIRHTNKTAESTEFDPEAPSVVLIHGLDDPGKVWKSLAPVISSMNVNVWLMRYPNDQPIVDSSSFVFSEMRRLSQLGVEEIALVTHSMGALVSREMLTRPQIAYADAARARKVPSVTALIMLAPPNHGSQMARFRMLSEVREQWVYAMEGGTNLLRGIVDGAGEARLDLIPKSPFLTTLNGRPHPDGVELLIVAGVIRPFAGDGLVSVESTRLDGVDHHIVPGTHATMIRNLAAGSSRVPPAVPIVTQALKQWLSASHD